MSENGLTATIAHVLCSVSSAIFSIVYLSVLACCALYRGITTRSTPKDPNTRLSKQERKLVFNFDYYVQLAGLSLEYYAVTTEDGYILDLYRFGPGDEAKESVSPKKRYPVLLIPGLMQAAAAYCTSGPEAIALSLYRQGFDVWLGNVRGGFWPRHIKYSSWSAKMWNWSIKDMASKDIPTLVNRVKETVGCSKIAIVAHSQGTAVTFMGLSKDFKPEVGKSVSSFSALAPAVYAGPLVDRWFLKLLRRGSLAYRTMIGYRAFLGVMGFMHSIMPMPWFTYFGYIMFHYMLGWSDALWDRHYRDRNFIFAPVFVSGKHMFWWLGKGGFADTKCIFNESQSPWFDEQFPPLALFAPGKDDLVLPERLINRIETHEPHVKMTVFDLPSYGHLDVLWARDAADQVARPLGKYIWSHIENQEAWQPIEALTI